MDDTLVLKEIENTNLSRELKLWLLKNYADKYWMALLNDWDYQWRKNSKAMEDLEIEWSEEYKYGIVWQVIDTWIELPEIFIATQGFPSTRQHLSPGDSFNWGNSIAFRNKP